MGKRWRIHSHDDRLIAGLERSAGIPAVLAQLLISRGVRDADHVRSFLDTKLTGLRDPEELPGIDEAADRIFAAVGSGAKIVIYGDYDADGMTATAILHRCMKMLGANVSYFVPNRMEEGYGLNGDALTRLASQGAKLVVTVDCGISSLAEAETAYELGVELIVTDHHQMADSLPRAAAIVHPRLPGHNYPFAGLCGAGVAFKLAWALCQRASQSKKVGERMRNFLISAVGLAAIGTVADVVPMLDENRVLVHHGLGSLKQQPLVGVEALMKVTKLNEKPYLVSEDIGFMLAPRLNAAGRLGQAPLAVELLTTESNERAEALAEYIDELNANRVSLERSIYLAAKKQATELYDVENDAALVLADRGWHAGVIGIVAGRLAEKYHRPVIIVSLDELGVKCGTGSARSAGLVNLHEALAACTDHLKAHGGHAAAAGLRIDEKQVDGFREAFCQHVAEQTCDQGATAELRIDAEIPLSQLTLTTVEQIERLAPFGEGNPRPALCTTGVALVEQPRKIGGGQRHLSIKLQQHGVTLRAVAFGKGEWAEPLAKNQGPLDIAFRPVINSFRGRRSVELHLDDWRATNDAG